MEIKEQSCRAAKARALAIRFVGDPGRGRRLQAMARHQGWRFCMPPAAGGHAVRAKKNQPDIVILDGFPDSLRARSAFYQWQDLQGPCFLALNDAPHARRFLHVNGLSFIRMIARDPGMEAFTRAVRELAPSNRKLTSRSRRTIGPETGTRFYQRINPCILQDQTCC